MDAKDYQQQAARTLNYQPHADLNQLKLANMAMGLAGETGELVDYLKKYIFHSHPLDLEKVSDELGDLFWYLNALCTLLELNAGTVMQANIDKLLERYPHGFSSQDSIKRVDVK